MDTQSKNKSMYLLMIRNSMRQRLIYRSGVWLQIISGVFFVMIQGSLWTALLQNGHENIMLKDMISFVLINSLVGNVVRFNAASLIGNRVNDGSIAIDMILPVSFKWKLFSEAFGENLFDLLFAGVPGLGIALVLYGASAPVSGLSGIMFLLSLTLGIVLAFQIQYIFNLSAFWIVNPWYVSFFTNGATKLFGGEVIPLWFYPPWLIAAGRFLPFRFCTFEPIQIYLGRVDFSGAWKCIAMQLFWIVFLLVVEWGIWRQASHKIFVQGG